MALQASEAPIRFGPDSEWNRLAAFKSAQSHQNCYEDDSLPKDPRQWTRENVSQWLTHMTTIHDLPEVPSSRFRMNGKALCLMSPDMFLTRVPQGGELLYQNFQLRLSQALYSTRK